MDPSADEFVEASILWNSLKPDLQLYIYDYLIEQFRYPEFVGEVLGISTTAVRRIAILKEETTLSPANTEELWNQCLSESNRIGHFVKPETLQKYVEYFAFASVFEQHASIYERHKAVAFLRRRQISGDFVTALDPDYDSKASLFNSTQLRMGRREEYNDSEWAELVSMIEVDPKHDPYATAPYFRSRYFPALLRTLLLVESPDDACAFHQWLVYGTVYLSHSNPAVLTDYLVQTLPHLIPTSDSATCGLVQIFTEWVNAYKETGKFLEHSIAVNAILWATATRAPVTRALLRTANTTDFPPPQSATINNSSNDHTGLIRINMMAIPEPARSDTSVPSSPTSHQAVWSSDMETDEIIPTSPMQSSYNAPATPVSTPISSKDIRRSPSPPGWSPISDMDEEMGGFE